MNIQIYGHGIETTDAIRAYVIEKIGHVGTILGEVEKIHVTLNVNHHHVHGDIFNVEIQTSVGKHSLHVEETASDLYAAIDLAEDVLMRQARKLHSQGSDRRRRLQQALSPRRYLNWGKRFFRR